LLIWLNEKVPFYPDKHYILRANLFAAEK
jgi:hypothetical protein